MARRHKPQPEPQPRRPTRSTKLTLDEAAKRVAQSVTKASKPPKPGMSDPGARRLEAEALAPGTRRTVQARPQPEPIDTPKEGITYGGTCKRCDQSVRVHMKSTEGTFHLLNFYDVRCVCKGQISLHYVGEYGHEAFAGLDPNHPSNARLESIDGVGKEDGK
jgi:hypothetical protein